MMSLAAPDLAQETINRRLDSFALQLDLTGIEETALASSASDLRDVLRKFSPNVTQEDAIRQVAERDTKINVLANAFLAPLHPRNGCGY